jgi:hypothetical protein
MERVEKFRGELLVGTKNLFGQFYQSKQDFNKMIFSTVAYGKINTLDRNLLERTCDVRWWALETAFSECVTSFIDARQKLYALKERVSGIHLSHLEKAALQRSHRQVDQSGFF